MSKQKKKSSAIFNSSEPLLGKKGNFIEVFPQIEKVKVDVQEFKDFWYKEEGIYPISHFSNESNLKPYIDCSEASCYGGGFSINTILHDMVGQKQPMLEDNIRCKGRIGNRSGLQCMHQFRYKVFITYK